MERPAYKSVSKKRKKKKQRRKWVHADFIDDMYMTWNNRSVLARLQLSSIWSLHVCRNSSITSVIVQYCLLRHRGFNDSFSTSGTVICDCDLPSYEISRLIKPGSDCICFRHQQRKQGDMLLNRKVTATRRKLIAEFELFI